MKSIIKVSQYFLYIIILSACSMTSSAQRIIDTSSPEEPLLKPAIVVKSSTVEPNCHSYTGCGVVVIKKSPVYKPVYKPKPYKPKPKCVYPAS